MKEILVGVDGSAASWDALDWAVTEAVARRAPLRVLHCRVLAPPPINDARVLIAPHFEAKRHVDLLLDEARSRATTRDPRVDVTCDSVDEPPVPGLLRAARDADMLVVGAIDRGALHGLLVGSTALQVAFHSPCSTVIVRPTKSTIGEYAGRIVVGVDGSEGSRAALEFAFDEAAHRNLPIAAVYAQTTSYPEWLAQDFDAEGRAFLADELKPFIAAYPDVIVSQHLMQNNAKRGLVIASHGAAMVVVGSRGHGGFLGLLLGSVSLALVQRASSPVAVVHTEQTKRARRAALGD